ncbi:MAG TPA: hypothetical protein VIJ38_01735 [Acidobacteriaceae bacterium]
MTKPANPASAQFGKVVKLICGCAHNDVYWLKLCDEHLRKALMANTRGRADRLRVVLAAGEQLKAMLASEHAAPRESAVHPESPDSVAPRLHGPAESGPDRETPG